MKKSSSVCEDKYISFTAVPVCVCIWVFTTQTKVSMLFVHFPGCYPECSTEKPYYDEERRECVSLLDCVSW